MDKRFVMNSSLRAAACMVGLSLVMVVVVGCDPGTSGGPDTSDKRKIQRLFDSVSRAAQFAAHQPEDFEQLFVAGAAPAESEVPRYAKTFFYANSVSVSGDTATVEVKVVTREDDLDRLAQWTLVREEESWKIKDAPLPDSL